MVTNLDINGDRRWTPFTADDPQNLADIYANPYTEAVADSEVGILAYCNTANTADALASLLHWSVEVVAAKREGGDLLACVDALAGVLDSLDSRRD